MQTARSEERWKALLSAARNWGSEPYFGELLNRISADAVQFSGFDSSAIVLLEANGLATRAEYPANRAPSPHVPSVAQQTVRSGRVVFGREITQNTGPEATSVSSMVFCAPLTAARGILGALYLETGDTARQLSDADHEFLETFALQAAMAIEHASLYHSAITDPLTGLLTHRHFQQEIEHAVRRGARTENPVSLLLLDLDHFKKLNDTSGHAVGNACLTQVAAILKRLLRTTDVIARFGGDEFEVLLPDTTPDSAKIVAEKIRAGIAELDFPVKVTGTVGLAGFPLNAADGTALFLSTDAALYEAKEAGRDRVIASAACARAAPSKERHRDASKSGGRSSAANAVAVRMADNLQEKIDGHALIRRLGAGSNGEVLLVRQPELDREVALKRQLTPHLTDEQIRGFEQEARVTASLNHPGVVPVHTMGRDVDGRRYYTMKPLEGFSLAHLLEQHRSGNPGLSGPYTQNRLMEALQRAGETIAYAHQRSVLHLDLTPSNIVLGEFGEVTVIDWGLGASHSGASPSSSRSGESTLIAGSPRYIAPEQIPASGGTPGLHSDVFALGAMLYEVLTLRPPFQAASINDTLRQLLECRVTPPELAAPELGIDPTLSELCLSCLKKNPTERPTAQQFAERLGRFLRRESEWLVTRFGPEHPVTQEEWLCLCGKFEFHEGEFVSVQQNEFENILLWKIPVQGSFRFIAEGWLEEHSGELSLIGAGTVRNGRVSGYSFHAAAESNTICKLGRLGYSVAATRDVLATPGQRHRVELEYQELEGWVRCYFDGKLVIKYREMFTFPGNYIGFYTFGGGAHLKPLEVHRQVWGLQVPAIRSADNLLHYKAYEAALERYREIAERAPNRLEGYEARLKMALCLSKLNRADEARAMVQSLEGSLMEPYALALQAELEMNDRRNYWRALEFVKDLLHRFPESQAKFHVNSLTRTVTNELDPTKMSLSETSEFQKQYFLAVRKTLWPPTATQVFSELALSMVRSRAGDWSGAFTDIVALHSALRDRQSRLALPHLFSTALAVGREDMLSYIPSELVSLNISYAYWFNGLALHLAVRLNKLPEYIQLCRDCNFTYSCTGQWQGCRDTMLAFVALENQQEAEALCEKAFDTVAGVRNDLHDLGMSIAECRNEGLLQCWLAFVEPRDGIEAAVRARWSLDVGDFELASRHIAAGIAIGSPFDFRESALLVMRLMLISLGHLKGEPAVRARSEYKWRLTGPHLELAEMFLEERTPFPTDKWPYPRWLPELRLWLALWLKATGRSQEALEIATPSLDPRYGNTHCQPALKQLIASCR